MQRTPIARAGLPATLAAILIFTLACGSEPASSPSAVEPSAVTEAPTTPEEIRLDTEEVIRESVRAAERALEAGPFRVFALVRRTDGRIQQVGAAEVEGRPVESQVLADLTQSLREGVEAGALRATAIVERATVPTPSGTRSDVVRVGLEHVSGYCVNAHFPYEKQVTGDVIFGEDRWVTRRAGTIFAACDDAASDG